jgi:hypothetical protein
MLTDDPCYHALTWALESLDAASSHLTLAALFAEGPAVRNDAALLAEAVEAEMAALCAVLDRH